MKLINSSKNRLNSEIILIFSPNLKAHTVVYTFVREINVRVVTYLRIFFFYNLFWLEIGAYLRIFSSFHTLFSW